MSFPQYMRIALDIANRIASGEIAERQRISGRSLLSSQYHVSPETVRKALSLLRDMDVVQVKEKSGVIILSADAARSFLSSFKGQREQQELRTQLHELTEQNQAISRRIAEVCDQLLEAQTTPLPTEQRLPNYELPVPAGSPRAGQSIGTLHFWQATGATIIAIRRKNRAGDALLTVINFTPVERPGHILRVPAHTSYTMLLDSSDEKYGGYKKTTGALRAKKQKDGSSTVSIDLPALGAAILKEKVIAKSEKNKQ